MTSATWRDNKTFARLPVTAERTPAFVCGMSDDFPARLAIGTEANPYERHLLTIASARSGKSVRVIYPNMIYT